MKALLPAINDQRGEEHQQKSYRHQATVKDVVIGKQPVPGKIQRDSSNKELES